MKEPRKLHVSTVFAPVDFSAWLSSGHSHDEIEAFIDKIETMTDDGSGNHRNNMLQIAHYRANSSNCSARP